MTGTGINPGDLVFGLGSSGIHSNGLSLARKVLLEKTGWKIDREVAELGKTIGEELLTPTIIYVPVILEIMEKVAGVKAFAHITGDGLLNLLRVESQVSFVIDHLPDPSPIFRLIQEKGFNMGIGFCIVSAPEDIHLLTSICDAHKVSLHRIGYAIESCEKYLEVKPFGLKGKGRTFGEL